MGVEKNSRNHTRKNLVDWIFFFNNAGITGLNEDLGPQDPENISQEAWDYVHKVNWDGVFLGCKYGIALMKKHGGSIINMSSPLRDGWYPRRECLRLEQSSCA